MISRRVYWLRRFSAEATLCEFALADVSSVYSKQHCSELEQVDLKHKQLQLSTSLVHSSTASPCHRGLC